MDLYILNFKQILVVLTSKNMRTDILDLIKDQEIEASFKFVDGYLAAAKLINEQIHDPFDNIILNLSLSNSKSRDFIEFLEPKSKENPNFLIDYNTEGTLCFAEVSE